MAPRFLPINAISPHRANSSIQCMGCGWRACNSTCLASHRTRFGCHNPDCLFHPARPPSPELDTASSSAPEEAASFESTTSTIPPPSSPPQSAEEALEEAYRALVAAYELLVVALQRARQGPDSVISEPVPTTALGQSVSTQNRPSPRPGMSGGAGEEPSAPQGPESGQQDRHSQESEKEYEQQKHGNEPGPGGDASVR